MGRGVSSGGGQSSLGYLFGGDADSNTQPPPPAPPAAENPSDAATTEPSQNSPEPASDDKTTTVTEESSEKPPSESNYNVINRNPNAAVHDNMTNNYHRPDGQNCGNYITNRPSTKVHAAPGGNSSLGYLFSDDRK
ncbi:SPIRAL1-like protein 1 [Tanacetum coccineum]|uniref:SPIRAL1-like protein 1 n=1 Tax=Tanacetum coccineum TaxID=301880 RepID=A0ABQ5DKB3_9ASTR